MCHPFRSLIRVLSKCVSNTDRVLGTVPGLGIQWSSGTHGSGSQEAYTGVAATNHVQKELPLDNRMGHVRNEAG